MRHRLWMRFLRWIGLVDHEPVDQQPVESPRIEELRRQGVRPYRELDD